MKRFFILCGIILISFMVSATVAEADTYTRPKKVVSIVMDDSSSMPNGGNWDPANYALQTLLGILNSSDEATLFYIGSQNPSAESLNLSDGGIQRELTRIRDKAADRGTYFGSVETAYRHLVSRFRPGGNEEYWLVVITDGNFEANNIKGPEARVYFERYAENGLGSEKYPINIIFFTIGKGADRIDDGSAADKARLLEKGIRILHADASGEIPARMNEVADMLSGRRRLDAQYIHRIDDRTVRVDSDIPLYNFVVMYQGTTVEPVSVTDGAGTQFMISRKLTAVSPSGKMACLLFTVGNGRQNIPKGSYTVTFNQGVDVSRLTILFDPALALHIRHFMPDTNEISIDALRQTAMETASYAAACQVFESGTAKYVPLNDLPKGTELRLEVRFGGRTAGTARGENKTGTLLLPNEQVTVSAALTLPGYPTITAVDVFTPTHVPTVSGAADNLPDTGGSMLKVTVEQLKHRKKYIDFSITIDGKLTRSADEIKKLGLVFNTEMEYDVEYPGNGKVRFIPKYCANIKLNTPYGVELVFPAAGKTVGGATVFVDPSTYAVEVTPARNKRIEITEARFRDNPQKFTFKLLVDGEQASAEEYGLTFKTALAFQTVWNGKNAEVTVSYKAGMKAGDYPVIAMYDGRELEEKAFLVMSESVYVIARQPAAASVKQSEFEGAPQEFRVTLTEDGKTIAPGALKIDAGSFPGKVTSQEDPKNKNGLLVTLSGDMTVPAGDYEIKVSYTAGTGTVTTETIKLTVEEAVYQISHTPLNQMIFDTVNELDRNTEAYTFSILADGRPLTDAEFAALRKIGVIRIEKDPQDTPAVIREIVSGYEVTPNGRGGKLPGANVEEALYSVVCTAGNASDTAEFQYRHMEYAVMYDGSAPQQIASTELYGNTKSLRFTVTGNGRRLDRGVLEGNYELSVDGRYQRHVTLKSHVEADGTIVVTPTTKVQGDGLLKRIWRSFRPLLLPKGEMTVTLTFKDKSDSGKAVFFTSDAWEEWKPYAILAFILFTLVMAAFKKRFPRGARISYVNGLQSDGYFDAQGSDWQEGKKLWSVGHLIPYRFRCTRHIGGATIRAGNGNAIQVHIPPSWKIAGKGITVYSDVSVSWPPDKPEEKAGWIDIDSGKAFIVKQGDQATLFLYYGPI